MKSVCTGTIKKIHSCVHITLSSIAYKFAFKKIQPALLNNFHFPYHKVYKKYEWKFNTAFCITFLVSSAFNTLAYWSKAVHWRIIPFIMIFAKAFRLFLQDPKSLAWYLNWRNHSLVSFFDSPWKLNNLNILESFNALFSFGKKGTPILIKTTIFGYLNYPKT